MDKNEILSYLKKHKNELKKKYKISQIVLFGSYAKEKANKQSDIDIAVKTPISDYFKLYELKEELEKAFQASVDIVRIRDHMNHSLKKHIFKDGINV
ncbi:type VII toxin-antitoxin system MntA family adenylyltransferase antitoxin [Nitratiruptor sp. SB155-2]|uniref:type VII toxin-antitoxin system MntA family adenylyltransferase antitoxin n=1 Tax=Nitratiruptor sp. (strain SB155-2) TaxID=387092 RepID=UPI0001586D7D|nr:nucleotidyltransferase domain-containing protein [Nitratiruptor sp. SB155-2]BAF69688.1 conserved hypothetical protein [Nitratiruptor sp. SB155-2]